MLLPNEEDKNIQDILKSDDTIERKSYQILHFYKKQIPYNRNRQSKQKEPPLTVHQIRMELDKRGENQSPIDL